MLTENQNQLLNVMAVLRGESYEKNGKRVSGKMFLLGENLCSLSEVRFRAARNGSVFIEVTFTRKPASIAGYSSKIIFAPFMEFIFDYDRARDLCAAFNWELKPQPSDMPFNVYFKHVAARIRTFIGQELKVAVSYYKETRTDKDGNDVMYQRYFDKKEAVSDWRQKIDAFYEKNACVVTDWKEISRIFAEEYDL